MHTASPIARLIVVGVLALLGTAPSHARTLPESVERDLGTAKYVYISSTRKDGSLSRPAEIWFLYHQGAVYVGTAPTSWRAKRIRAGRPQAKIAVGTAEGPSFKATGDIVKDAAVQQLMLDTYAKKYPDGWPKYEQRFRDGFKDGSRILIKYAPAPQ